MYSTIPTHETEEQALLAVKSKRSPTTDLVAFVPVPPNVDMRAEKIMVSTEVGSPTSDDYNNRLYFYEVIQWDPNDPDDPNRPPDDQSDGAGALATGLLVMLPALVALAL